MTPEEKKKLAILGGGLAVAGVAGFYLKDKLGIGEGLESYATGGADWAVSGGGGYIPGIPTVPDTPIPIDPAKPFPDYDPSGGYGGNTIGFAPSFGGNDLPINPPPETEDQGRAQYTIINKTIPEGFLGGRTSEVVKPKDPTAERASWIFSAMTGLPLWTMNYQQYEGSYLQGGVNYAIDGLKRAFGFPVVHAELSNVPPTQSGSPKIPYPQRPIGSTYGSLPHYMRAENTKATSQPIGLASPFAGFGWGSKTPSTPTFTGNVVKTMKTQQVITSLDKPSWLG